MDPTKRDKTKVDPLTAAEEKEPAAPLKTVPEGQTQLCGSRCSW